MKKVTKIFAVVSALVCGFSVLSACGEKPDDGQKDEPKHEHKFGMWSVIRYPDCTMQGLKQRQCILCDESEEVATEAYGHVWGPVIEYTPPTCTAYGNKEYRRCDICHTDSIDFSIKPLGHDYQPKKGKLPELCGELWWEDYFECSRCGSKVNYLPQIKYCEYGDWIEVKAPTCTEEGYSYQECVHCSEISERFSSELGHLYNAGKCERCGEELEALEFTLKDDDTYEVKAAYTTISEAVIPNEFDGKRVTAIADNGFKECKSLKTVQIPESIESIGYSAFASCIMLESIEIPSSVKDIKSYTFGECTSLRSVILPEGIKVISDLIFINCESLENVNIPDGVVQIGEFAFAECSALKEIFLPDGLTNIGERAFIRCSSLEKVRLPDSLIRIEGFGFNACAKLEKIVLPAALEYVGWMAFAGDKLLTVYCRSEYEPSTWNEGWNLEGYEVPVVWGYTGE